MSYSILSDMPVVTFMRQHRLQMGLEAEATPVVELANLPTMYLSPGSGTSDDIRKDFIDGQPCDKVVWKAIGPQQK